jgi:hypothetical protein
MLCLPNDLTGRQLFRPFIETLFIIKSGRSSVPVRSSSNLSHGTEESRGLRGKIFKTLKPPQKKRRTSISSTGKYRSCHIYLCC